MANANCKNKGASMLSLRNKRVWIAGHNGLIGRALLNHAAFRDSEILTADRKNLDLRRQDDVRLWLAAQRPEIIILAAAMVGGIEANRTRPAEFLYDNLMIAGNVIEAAATSGVEKLLYLGSSCIYPREAAQPITEAMLLTGPLEPTNEFYAVAKIAGIKLCQSYRRQYGCDFIAAMPCNLYGEGDRFDELQSHVIPALILKLEQARLQNASSVTLWGTGTPKREFLYADDLADALVIMLQHYSGELALNIGSGQEISIAALATMIAERVGYRGALHFDAAWPDGAARKILDSTHLRNLGWIPQTTLAEGLDRTLAWYRRETGPRHA